MRRTEVRPERAQCRLLRADQAGVRRNYVALVLRNLRAGGRFGGRRFAAAVARAAVALAAVLTNPTLVPVAAGAAAGNA